jgi:beta-phosphoglucomutase
MGYPFMKYKGIIFDLDGVIVSTDRYHYLAWKQIADTLGILFTPEDNNRLRGVSRRESLEILLSLGLRTVADREKQELMEEKNRVYRRMLEALSPTSVEPEVRNTLSVLKERGIKTAIGSSSMNAKLILEKIGLLGNFDAISDGNNIGNSKPDPEIFNKAAIMLEIKNRDILVVEDSSAGIEAAGRGGFDSVGIGNAFEDKNATYHIESLIELLSL